MTAQEFVGGSVLSKTQWLNATILAIGFVQANPGPLRSILGGFLPAGSKLEAILGGITMGLAILGFYIRAITDESLADKYQASKQ